MAVPSLSLGRRVALIVAVLVVVPAAVCAAIFVQVSGMNADADRLVEETRESALASRLVVRVESLASLLEPGEAARQDAHVARIALVQVEEARRALAELAPAGEGAADPSREEHQDAEEQLAGTVAVALDAAAAWLAGDDLTPVDEVRALLERGRRHASVLADETHDESRLADADVERRARATLVYAVVALVIVVLLAGAVIWLVQRLVLAPIRELRTGAERLRSGDLDARIRVRQQDEVGELASAFNAMADEIGRSHAELEQKIEARTLELLRAARLADVGVLAAGLAHEINNPLASIASCGEGLLRRLDRGEATPDAAREYLGTIVSEAYRTREITARLLDLSRPTRSRTSVVDTPALFEQARTLAQHLLDGRGIRVEVEVGPALPRVEGDTGELLQVLLNLLVNARDASPDGATVRLVARAEGDDQVWEVHDQGEGIAPDDLERIFDPFFTTKEPGLGTGLGLSLVAAIVDRHDGSIRARSEVGRGSVFEIRLPSRRHAPAAGGLR